MQTVFALLMFIASIFLILLVLVQRGRGGGLSGAFGGLGGQSAFGAKAGDTFTRVTIVSAAVWILLCMLATGMMGDGAKDKSVFSAQSATDVIDELSEGDLDFSEDVPPAPADIEQDAGAGETGEGGAAAEATSATTAPAEVSTEAAVDPVDAPAESAPAESAPAE